VQNVGADASVLSLLPTSICLLYAAIHLNGMLRIEEYRNGQGYRLSWSGTNSPLLRLFCIIDKNLCSIENVPGAFFDTVGDVMLSPLQQVRNILHWLINLAKPDGEEAMPLSGSICDLLNQRDRREPELG